jgi:hypothetical protein
LWQCGATRRFRSHVDLLGARYFDRVPAAGARTTVFTGL